MAGVGSIWTRRCTCRTRWAMCSWARPRWAIKRRTTTTCRWRP